MKTPVLKICLRLAIVAPFLPMLAACPAFSISATGLGPTSPQGGANTGGGNGGNATGNSGGSSSSSTSGSSGNTGGGTSGSGSSGSSTAYNKLPDTSQGSFVSVYAISDQPAQGIPSDPVARFAAAHFAGTQKMTAAGKAKFAAYNPNWIQLHYRLGAASGPADFIHNDNWGLWANCNLAGGCGNPVTHPSGWSGDWFTLFQPSGTTLAPAALTTYFLRDASGNPNTFDGTDMWYAHDLSNSAMQSWWLTTTATDLQDNNSDMIFGDSFTGVIGCAMTSPGSKSSSTGLTSQCDSRLQGTGALSTANWGSNTYANQLNQWMVQIQNYMHQLPESPLFIPNLGSLNTEWFFGSYDFTDADGAFLEGFPEQNENSTDYPAADNYALQLTSANKVVIIQSYIQPNNIDERLFCVGTYLLIKGQRTFINMVGGSSGTGFYYWPEYTVQLGDPLSGPPSNINNVKNGGVYQRSFQNGFVLVNASASSMNATLPFGTYYQVIPAGGGGVNATDLDAQGNLSSSFMSLTSQAVSGTISLNAWSGAILLNQPVP